MELTYELTQRDFSDSMIAHRDRVRFTKWGLRIGASVGFVAGAVGLLMLGFRPNAETLSNVTPLFLLGSLWLIFLWAVPRWAARNQFLKQPSAQGPRTVLLDATGVHWRWDGGSSDVEWKNYIRFLESKHQFLLYTSPACFNILPKRGLTPQQLSELRAFLEANVSRNRKGS